MKSAYQVDHYCTTRRRKFSAQTFVTGFIDSLRGRVGGGVAPPPLGGKNYPNFESFLLGCNKSRFPDWNRDGGHISQERLQQHPPPLFKKICRSAYDFEFEIEKCVFPFLRGTGFACTVSNDSTALYGSFLNSRIEKCRACLSVTFAQNIVFFNTSIII